LKNTILQKVCAGIDYYRIKNNISGRQLHMLRLKVLAGGIAALVVLLMAIAPTGYLGPLSARIRGGSYDISQQSTIN